MFQTGPIAATAPRVSESAIALPAEDYYADATSSWEGLSLPSLDSTLSEVTDAVVATVGAVGIFSALFKKLWNMAWEPAQ